MHIVQNNVTMCILYVSFMMSRIFLNIFNILRLERILTLLYIIYHLSEDGFMTPKAIRVVNLLDGQEASFILHPPTKTRPHQLNNHYEIGELHVVRTDAFSGTEMPRPH